ncbi:MAG: DUF1837 domain-containing protein [Gemmatimonas sp.]|jgi:hypothetical protein|uniref:HamA C-terminal domain-containing protein n=1 Tax=Gemmatimonas sp. TaxID=1962908 RepID=UPI0025B9BD60|nr:DUF1837 domain-containing protein [Gemmatimonas sp.]MCA2988608.1 DUF1837 domain-containing protein [Gemmatimonas sp.]
MTDPTHNRLPADTEAQSHGNADSSTADVGGGFSGTGLSNALERLARGERADLVALLHEVEIDVVLDGTKLTCHCYALKIDGNGRPRVSELAEAICESMTDFAIPRSRIEDARARDAQSGSTRNMTRLQNEARSLFTDIANSGEGGELLLFVLAEILLQLPQVLCKMSLKTNTRMHVHGVDGVHAGVDPDTGRLALYWGESKIYGDATAAIRECLASLAPMLVREGPQSGASRDLQLLQRAMDVNDPALELALKQFLDPRHEAYNTVEFRGLCLVGFDCDAYPRTGAQQEAVVSAVLAQLPRWKQALTRRVQEEVLDGFALHVFCVPFPDVESFREHMRGFIGIRRAAA